MRALLLLLAMGYSGCSRLIVSDYQPVILLHDTMPRALATTTCSLNNEPIILIDSTTWYSLELREVVVRHEETHAHRAKAYPGGCWPYMYRTVRDKAFRVKEQLLAFCDAGKYALTRNHNPESLWLYIVNVMRPDTVLTSADNCLYDEGTKR